LRDAQIFSHVWSADRQQPLTQWNDDVIEPSLQVHVVGLQPWHGMHVPASGGDACTVGSSGDAGGSDAAGATWASGRWRTIGCCVTAAGAGSAVLRRRMTIAVVSKPAATIASAIAITGSRLCNVVTSRA